jgi:hypothetical protein
MKITWKKTAITSVALLGLLLTSASSCDEQDTSNGDLKGVTANTPEKIEGYNNVDGHPNIVVLCIHKVAWVTTSRAGEALRRVPEYDVPVCGGVESKWAEPRPDVRITMQQAG